ncbi:hypothetical protein RIF29_25101 [Crotalaria pallida]|uniref:Uncharacterized protein n=1 Tax=Crotalaria pallida TaxID=3830 RepID=A0AAN9HX63_CROPI
MGRRCWWCRRFWLVTTTTKLDRATRTSCSLSLRFHSCLRLSPSLSSLLPFPRAAIIAALEEGLQMSNRRRYHFHRRLRLSPSLSGLLPEAADLGGAGIVDGGTGGGEGDLRQRRFERDFSVAILTVKTGNSRSIVEITSGTVCVRDHEKTVLYGGREEGKESR